MKKVLSLVMVIAMVLSSMTFAFADFKDVPADNAKLTQATSLLSALGIIEGYEDGSFKPEKTVTRAEMAKMMISALGYGDIATDTPKFTDCQKHWAKGYISLANDLGIIEGVGNNKFDPDSQVTYEQATAMLLRALGYTNENLNGGKSTTYNSAAYKTKALSLGLYSPLKSVDMKAAANRGDIALMLNVDLQQGLVITNEFGRPGFIGEVLVGKLATKVNIPSVSVEDMDPENKNVVDLTPYLFQNIDVYKVGKSVIYVAANNSTTVEGYFVAKDGDLVVVKADETTLTLDIDATLTKATEFYNGAMATEDKNLAAINGGSGKVVYDKETKLVKAVICYVYDNPKQVVTTYKTGKTIFAGYELPKDTKGKVDYTKITVTGDATTLEDIKAKDVVEVAMADGKVAMNVIVTRNTVEGKVTKIDTVNGKYYINGTAYKLNGTTLELGYSGIFYLDSNGYICAKAVVAEDTSVYGIVKGTAEGVAYGKGAVANDGFGASSITRYPQLKVVGMDGKVQVLDIACALKDGAVDNTKVAEGAEVTLAGGVLTPAIVTIPAEAKVGNDVVVKYTLNKDGKIDSIEAVKTGAPAEAIKTSNKNFLATDNTVILNYSTTAKAYSVVKVSDLDTEKITFQYVGDAVDGWDLVILTDKIADTSDDVYGFITAVADTFDAAGDPINEITALVNGATVTYVTEDDELDDELDGLVNKMARMTVDGNFVTDAGAAEATPVAVETVTDQYLVFKDQSTRAYLAENYGVYKVDADGKVKVGDLVDVDFVKDEKAYVIGIIKVDGEITTIVISPAPAAPEEEETPETPEEEETPETPGL